MSVKSKKLIHIKICVQSLDRYYSDSVDCCKLAPFLWRLLYLRHRKPSAPEVLCFRLCLSVSESVRPVKSVNTISQKAIYEISPNLLLVTDVLESIDVLNTFWGQKVKLQGHNKRMHNRRRQLAEFIYSCIGFEICIGLGLGLVLQKNPVYIHGIVGRPVTYGAACDAVAYRRKLISMIKARHMRCVQLQQPSNARWTGANRAKANLRQSVKGSVTTADSVLRLMARTVHERDCASDYYNGPLQHQYDLISPV